jgi:hypothetical protein
MELNKFVVFLRERKQGAGQEISNFKLYKSQNPVVERAIETAAPMGSDKSRGYCLEMTCADFLAAANLDSGNPETLLYSISRFFKFPPNRDELSWKKSQKEWVMNKIYPRAAHL